MYIICNDKINTLSLQKRGRPEGKIFDEILRIRIDKESKEKLFEIAKKKGKTPSEILRKQIIKIIKEGENA